MTDTAEYWWDVKRQVNKKVFIHIKGFDCGHFHVRETNKLTQVNCYACLQEIKNNKHLTRQLDNQKAQIEANRFKYGKCDCGKPMCVRINKTSKETFLGCTNYPKCKNTKVFNREEK